MPKLFKTMALSFLTAVGLTLIDVAFLDAAPHSFWASPDISPMNKARLLATDFLFLFFILGTFSGFLICQMPFVQTAGLWLAMGGVVFYIISWTTFFYTDQFIDIEGVRFFFHNIFQLLEFVFQTSLPLFVLFFAIVILVPWILGLLVRRWISNGLARWEVGPMIGWGIVAAVAAAILIVFPGPANNPGMQRIMRNGLSPQATLVEDYFLQPLNDQTHVPVSSGFAVRWNKRVPLQQILKAPSGQAHPLYTPVILIVIESMRSDVLKNGRVMPHLFELKQDGLYYNNSFPASNESDYAWPAILSSQYPLRSARHYYYPSHIHYPRAMIYDVLKAKGYKTAIFSAQNEEWGNMRNYLDTGHLDTFFDANTEFAQQHPGIQAGLLNKLIVQLALARKADDSGVLDHALQWIGDNRQSPFFLALNFQRSHFPYTWPSSFEPRFKPYALTFGAVFAKYPRSQVTVMRNRYDNALAYIDQQIGRLTAFLKEHHLYDQSLIIVTGDHGEAFYERNTACHAAELDPQSTHTFILLKAPGETPVGVKDRFVENIDIPPTICHFLNIPIPPDFQGRDIFARPGMPRPIFMTVNTPRANQDAVIEGEWKFVKDYKNGREYLFNIEKDFMEDHNLVYELPEVAGTLRGELMVWRGSQLEYYRNRKEQDEFYPPQF